MMIYVSANSVQIAKKACEGLQNADWDNCYISPLTSLSCLFSQAMTDDAKNALRIDMLSVCDVLVVASDISTEMQEEIEFAELVGMEVRYIASR